MKFSIRTLAIVLALVLVCGVTAMAATPARLFFQNSAGTVVCFEIEDFLGNTDLEGPFAQWLQAASTGGKIYIGDTDGKAVEYAAGTSLQDQLAAKEDVSGTALAGVTIYKAVAVRDGKLIISATGEDGTEVFFEIETPDSEPVETEFDPNEEPGEPGLKYTWSLDPKMPVPFGNVGLVVEIEGVEDADTAALYKVTYDGVELTWRQAVKAYTGSVKEAADGDYDALLKVSPPPSVPKYTWSLDSKMPVPFGNVGLVVELEGVEDADTAALYKVTYEGVELTWRQAVKAFTGSVKESSDGNYNVVVTIK